MAHRNLESAPVHLKLIGLGRILLGFETKGLEMINKYQFLMVCHNSFYMTFLTNWKVHVRFGWENWFLEPLSAEHSSQSYSPIVHCGHWSLWSSVGGALRDRFQVTRVTIPMCSTARDDQDYNPYVQCESPGRVTLWHLAGTKISQSHQKYLVVRDRKI